MHTAQSHKRFSRLSDCKLCEPLSIFVNEPCSRISGADAKNSFVLQNRDCARSFASIWIPGNSVIHFLQKLRACLCVPKAFRIAPDELDCQRCGFCRAASTTDSVRYNQHSRVFTGDNCTAILVLGIARSGFTESQHYTSSRRLSTGEWRSRSLAKNAGQRSF